ncbi:hypothetical protein F4813DRAFT_386262 [Daldinia decipiens]|uniref:uncharacterized protein n=1 Tax=Daldinia decipiens TaxID=326647 RepID=UPI0020C2A0E5|nr:uncharacterized protein F4813DRAFT_386262 [Daldinia decipiens]KAI1660852.1 hypothetical protein F4813DRAFT_386262 [Daldinia decipiens]
MLERFRKKIKRRSNSADRHRPSSDGNTTATSSRFGLFPLHETPRNQHGLAQYPVDIIAVHGLHGDAFTTWTHPNGKMWLRDFLPSFLPGCRIYTYGYPSQIFFNPSLSRVKEHSRRLLSLVRDLQDDSSEGPRPIIFVSHSLGGIVCKQALVFAHEEETNYGAVLRSIVGIIFLGTPHKGSNLATLGSIVGTIINSLAVVKPAVVKPELLHQLKYNAEELHDLSLSVRNRFQNMTVITFYETEPLPPFSCPVVDPASAIIGLPNEVIIPLNENHRDLCRFDTETESYISVSNAIKRIACQALKCSSTHSSNRSLSSIEVLCINLFNKFDIEEYKRLLPQPAKGTCQWIKSHPVFMSWFHELDNALLWLTGHPGCGKTVLSYALAQSFEDPQSPPVAQDVLVYFCDNKVTGQRDARAILTSLIFQILRHQHSLIQHVQRAVKLQGRTLVESFQSLWKIFLKVIKHARSGPLYIIIDALDECERSTCRLLLESLHGFLIDPESSVSNRNGIKFLITSRPSREIWSNTIQITNRISIDEGQPGYKKDLQTFIQQRIDEISYRRDYSIRVKEYLLKTLSSKTDQTFLWLHMVLESLEESVMSSIKDIKDIVTKIPPTLEKTYLGFLGAISSGNQQLTSRLLQLILASSRPLFLDEINIAFTIDSSHRTADAVSQDCQSAVAHTIRGLLGPFARILDSKVFLVHQSAKDFLLEAGRVYDSFPTLRMISKENAELQMSISCIRYLLLEDFSHDFSNIENSPVDSIFESSEIGGSSSIDTGSLKSEANLHLDWLYHESGNLEPGAYQSLTSKYKLYSYASSHWMEHLTPCETSAPAWLREAAKTLLDVRFSTCRNWLHFYWANVAGAENQDPTSLDQLTLAAFFNLHETVVDLLGQDIPQRVKNQALFWASRVGNSRIVVRLLEAGADPNAQGLDMHTALTAAAAHSHLDCVNALLANERTDPDARGKNGRSALSFACGTGYDEMVKVLLDKSSGGVDEMDKEGQTPLFWAVSGGHISLISVLAKRTGANINHRDRKGFTIMSWAAYDGMEEVLGRLLRLRLIDANAKDKEGLSPLSLAARYGHSAAVAVLVQHQKVDKASIDRNKRNAISWACGRGHVKALHVLLDHGCQGVDDEDVNGWAPLAWAIQNNVPEIIQALTSTGKVNIDRRDLCGRTALYWAVNYGHAPVVKALLQVGADPRLASNDGQTPAMVATAYGREDILNELFPYLDHEVVQSNLNKPG